MSYSKSLQILAASPYSDQSPIAPRKSHRILAACLIVHLLSAKAGAVVIPHQFPKPRVGILRVGKTTSTHQEKAFELVEKQVQRWVENASTVPIEIKTLPVSLQVQQIREASERARFQQTLNTFRQVRSESLFSELSDSVERLKNNSQSLPLVQEALVEMAKYRWEIGKKKDSISFIQKAALLHPDGIFSKGNSNDTATTLDWDESLTEIHPWQKAQQEVLSAVRPVCEIQFRGDRDAELTVNGFQFGRRREFHLPSGGRYLFQITSLGHEKWESEVDCRKQSYREFQVRLRPVSHSSLNPSLELNRVLQTEKLNSLLLIETVGDKFRFLIFSPGNSLQEVPLQKPLKIAQVLENPREGLPVTSDSWHMLFEKDTLSAVRLSSSSEDSTQVVSAEFKQENEQWYNNWKWWAVAGGVITGVLVGYLATQSHPVQSQGAAAGIRIQFK